MHWLVNIFEEMSRRRMFRSAAAYLVGAWVFIEVSTTVLPLFGASDDALKIVVLFCVAAFPFAMALAWAYDITREGIQRTPKQAPSGKRPTSTARVIDLVLMAVLLGVGAMLVKSQFFSNNNQVQIVDDSNLETVELAVVDETPSIAVLPFENISTDPNNEIFGDGLAEELLNRLANLSGIRVAARTSAFRFKNSQEDIRDIAKQLNVSTILEGSVSAVGDNIRVTAQLIDAETGFHLWSKRYDRKLTNVFAIQDDIAKLVAANLKIELLGNTAEKLEVATTTNIDAYRLYLSGRREWHKRTSTSVDEAVELFNQAITLDDDFAPAYSGLADAYIFKAIYGNVSKQEAVALALPHATRALELDPELAEGHASMGLIYQDQYRFSEAADAFTKAIELRPNYAMAHMWLGTALLWVDEMAGLRERKIAVELDPLSPIANHLYAEALSKNGKVDEAKEQYRKLIEFAPDYPGAYRELADLLARRNDYVGAINNFKKSAELDPGLGSTAAEIGMLYFELGDLTQASEWVDRASEIGSEHQVVMNITFNSLLFSGKEAEAEAYLEKHKDVIDPITILNFTGGLAYYRGDYQLAAEKFDAIFAMISEIANDKLQGTDRVEKYYIGPDSAIGALFLADAAKKSGNEELAQELSLKLLDFTLGQINKGRDNNNVLFVRSGAFATLGRTAEALNTLQQLADQGWPAISNLETIGVYSELLENPRYLEIKKQIEANAKQQLSALAA